MTTGRWTRDGRRWSVAFALWWSGVSALAGVMGWLLFWMPGGRHAGVSGDLLGWNAALAVVSGFLVGAAQAGVLTAHGVAGERAAMCHWLGTALVWSILWPAWLVAPAVTGYGQVFSPLWPALPWLIFGAISGAWLLARVRFSPQLPPDDDGTPRLFADQEQAETAPGEAARPTHMRRAAVAASDWREAA